MKTPALIAITVCVDMPASVAERYATVTIKAFLKRLSLKAPKNCVAKNGKNPRCTSSFA